jgi:hypothetical protein
MCVCACVRACMLGLTGGGGVCVCMCLGGGYSRFRFVSACNMRKRNRQGTPSVYRVGWWLGVCAERYTARKCGLS